MPTVNVNIQPAILNWALGQTNEEKLGEKLVENIKHWLDGSKCPTFNQIEEFSKKAHIPIGYFFLQTPPKEQVELLEYRTVDSIESTNPSRDLLDTIHEMETVQEWMADYNKELYYDKVEFVGSLNGITDIKVIVNKIRMDLGLDLEWYKECDGSSKAFTKVRGLLEKCGILVMVNGIVGKNTHRALNLNEFRAFAIVNEWAPLIFINGADSSGGRLFSLFHELAHLWLGKSDLYNDRKYSLNITNSIEVICNAAAGELMVPTEKFVENWKFNMNDDIYEKIGELSKLFRCSESVIARRALDNRMIKKSVYDKVITCGIEHYLESRKERSSGGDYYRVVRSKLDGAFVRALCESVNSGRTSYTEAYRLTNTTSKTFSEVANGLGGVLW